MTFSCRGKTTGRFCSWINHMKIFSATLLSGATFCPYWLAHPLQCTVYNCCTFPSSEVWFGPLCTVAREQWQPLFQKPALFLPVSEGGIPSTAQPYPRPLTILHSGPHYGGTFPSQALQTLSVHAFISLFLLLFPLSAVRPTMKSVENVGLPLSRQFQSAWQSWGILFDTVRWPGKLKTQLKWQSRGQLFCIWKALLWLFYTNYIC